MLTGKVRQEMGDRIRSLKTVERRQETGNRRGQKEDRNQKTGCTEKGDLKKETDGRHETGDRRWETGDGRQDT